MKKMNHKIKNTIIIILIVISYSTMALAQKQKNSGNYLVLKNVTVLNCVDKTPVKNQTIVIKNGFIKDIFESFSNKAIQEAEVLDLAGYYILPGLIEGHNHISGVSDDELKVSLKYGVTAIRDMAGDALFLRNIQTRIDNKEIQAPDIYYSALFAGEQFIKNDFRVRIATPDSVPLGYAPWVRQIDAQTNISQAVREAKECGATGIKLYAYLTPAMVNAIVSEAHRQGLKVWSHAFVYPTRPEDLVAANVDGLSHAPFLLYPPNWEYQPNGSFDLRAEVLDSKRTDYILDEMNRKSIFLDPTLYLFKVTINEQADKKPELKEKLELAYEVTRKAYRKGVKIAVGTDFSLINEVTKKPTIFDEIYLLVNDIGFTHYEAIIAVTKHNAMILGIDNMYGTIEIGKKANLIVLSQDPLKNIRNLENPALIIKNGIIEFDARIKN